MTLHEDGEESPEQRAARFRGLLKELGLQPAELTRRLQGLGDFRTSGAIARSFQRMSAGDTAVSSEALMLVRLLVNQQRLWTRVFKQGPWIQQPHGIWTSVIHDFWVTLHPKTRDRWLINLRYHDPLSAHNGYSPPWQPLVEGLEAAQRNALACVADGWVDLCELERDAQAK